MYGVGRRQFPKKVDAFLSHRRPKLNSPRQTPKRYLPKLSTVILDWELLATSDLLLVAVVQAHIDKKMPKQRSSISLVTKWQSNKQLDHWQGLGVDIEFYFLI